MKISPTVERVNYLWIIAVLLLVVSFVVLKIPSGDLVRDYISFAASIASLVLAVVAIFYSIVSNQSFYQHVGSLQDLAESIRAESNSISSNLENFSSRAEALVTEVSAIPGSVDRLTNTVTEKLNTISPAKVDKKESEEAGTTFLPRATVGANISVYLIARAAKSGKKFNTIKAFDDDVLRNYITGVVTTLGLTDYKGLKMEIDGYEFTVTDPGEMDVDAMIKKGQESTTEVTKSAVKKIDTYFGISKEEIPPVPQPPAEEPEA